MKKTKSRSAARMRFAVPAAALAAVMVVTLAPVAVAASNPPITTAVRTLIQRVPDGSITHNGVTRLTYAFGGLVIVGDDDAYLFKSDTSGEEATGWTTFFHINDFNTPDAVTVGRTVRMKGSTVPYDMGHPNGLEYYRTPGTDYLEVGSFYIPMIKAVGDHQVAQVNNQGEITKLYKAKQGSTHKKIASIAYKGNGTWIVGTASENTSDPNDPNIIRKPYYTATIVGDHFELGTKFFVPTTRTFNIGQDIYYDKNKDQLLVPVWDGKNTVGTATGRKNRVIVVTLGTITNNKVYSPVRWIDLTVPASAASKFEIEGIARDGDGKLIVGSNIIHPDGVTHIDGIHKLTGQ